MSISNETAKVVVSGSFSFKFQQFPYVLATALTAQRLGFEVVQPKIAHATPGPEGFIRLEGDDPAASPRDLEKAYLDAIEQADGLIISNHRHTGRMGFSTTAEFAWAALCGTPRYITHLALPRSRPHPDIWYSNDITPGEAAALDRVPYKYFDDRQASPAVWKQAKAASSPMPETHEDYLTLRGLCARLLDSLSPQPSGQLAS